MEGRGVDTGTAKGAVWRGRLSKLLDPSLSMYTPESKLRIIRVFFVGTSSYHVPARFLGRCNES